MVEFFSLPIYLNFHYMHDEELRINQKKKIVFLYQLKTKERERERDRDGNGGRDG